MHCPASRPCRVGLGLLLGAALVLGGTLPTLAAPGDQDTVTQTLTAGPLSASVASLVLAPIASANTDQTQTGSLILTADDSTGSGDGWNVTLVTSAFVYSGSFHGTDIPAANLSLTGAAGLATSTAGQPTDPSGGPKVPATSPLGSLSTARKVVAANANFGLGTYTQTLGVALLVPAFSRVGIYTGTLTTTISSAP